MSIIELLVGVFLGGVFGYWISVWQAAKQFREERADILKALLGSLNKNVHYIKQMEDLHFPRGETPTFPFDTVALAHTTLHARKYLPKGTNWAEHYNGLRFELDHINRKLLMYHIAPKPAHEELNAIKGLITNVKGILESEIHTLSKFILKN